MQDVQSGDSEATTSAVSQHRPRSIVSVITGWEANLRMLDIGTVKSVPYSPASHPFVERLIGSVRREYLDQTLFWNSLDLERKLSSFREYYNGSRVHSSLGGKTHAESERQSPKTAG